MLIGGMFFVFFAPGQIQVAGDSIDFLICKKQISVVPNMSYFCNEMMTSLNVSGWKRLNMI